MATLNVPTCNMTIIRVATRLDFSNDNHDNAMICNNFIDKFMLKSD